MEKFKVLFEANNQQLKAIGTKHASDTYADIEATFILGERWTDMDSVSAVWWNDFNKGVTTVLDSEGKCIVPHEVLTRKGCVRVNLVGSVVEGDELVTRLTSYSAEAVQVNEKIKLTGSESEKITPSEYEQFVANVKADADRAETAKEGAREYAESASDSAESALASAQASEASALRSASSASESAEHATASANSAEQANTSAQNAEISAQSAETAKEGAEDARDEIRSMRANAETLEPNQSATASYSDGVLTLGIPRGQKGDTGEKGDTGDTGATPSFTIGTVETLEPNESATATITGDAENPVLNLGIPQGKTGEVSYEDLASLLPRDTASGSLVTIPDGQSVIPVKSLEVELEPIQSGSGTPSPDNVRPISGHTEVNTHRTGKNLFDGEWESGAISNSNGENIASNASIRTKNFIPLEGGKRYIISWQAQSLYMLFMAYKADGTFSRYISAIVANPDQFSLNEDEAYIRFYAYNNTVEPTNMQIELGSTATAYEPYQGTTYTTDLGQTVYGGTLDVVSGEMVVDRAMVDLGSLNWIYSGGFFRITNLTNFKKPSSNSAVVNAISSAYSAMSWNAIQRTSNGAFAVSAGSDNPIFCNTEYSDATSFKTAMNGVQLCYELATPQTIQLTPTEVRTLLGTNNVWSDGKVTLTYNADIQRYIEKKLNGNSTTLTMSRPMTAEMNETETETEETE